MGAMFGQTSGLPLSVSIGANGMDTQDSFFPEITTLGDILQKEGYSQTLLIGSEATFGGRKLYFTDHGQYDIMDYDYAHDNGLIRKTIKSGGDMRMKIIRICERKIAGVISTRYTI